MYVSFLSPVVTGMVHDCTHRHSPFSGWSSLFLQLHVFPLFFCGCAVSAIFRMALLWPSIICLTLGMQL